MKDELQVARERRLQRWIDQTVADFRHDFQWPQGPLEKPQPSSVEELAKSKCETISMCVVDEATRIIF